MSTPAPLTALNRAIRENDLDEVTRQLAPEPGMRAVEFAPGLSRWEWEASAAHVINPFGFVRGGYLSVFAGAVIDSAIGTVLADGELATTAEMKIAYLKPAKPGVLHGEGNVVQKGSRVAFVEARIANAAGDPVASVTSTWTIMRAGS
ncbi:MAG TPA: PaaI family thioesterase [Candidatus Kryptonia bacterium]|nr:PaaI family thioesterase [Candidatus Kryptonia bacterium]